MKFSHRRVNAALKPRFSLLLLSMFLGALLFGFLVNGVSALSTPTACSSLCR